MKKSGKCQTKRDRPVYSRIATTSHARRKPIGPMARIQGISKSPSCISAWFMWNNPTKKRGPEASRLSIPTTIPAAPPQKIQLCRTESNSVFARFHFPSLILRKESSGQNVSESSKNFTRRVGPGISDSVQRISCYSQNSFDACCNKVSTRTSATLFFAIRRGELTRLLLYESLSRATF